MTTAHIVGKLIHVRCAYSLKDAAKSILGCRPHYDGDRFVAWTYPATPEHAAQIVDTLGADGLPADVMALAERGAGELVSMGPEQWAGQLMAPIDDQIAYAGRLAGLTDLRDYQSRGVVAMIDAYRRGGAFCANFDMGTGKTLTAAAFIHTTRATPILVACPLAVVDVWPADLAKHGVRARCVPLRGTVARKVAQADALLRDITDGEPTVIVTNYDAIRAKPFAEWAQRQQWAAVIADEVHRIKSAPGQASRVMAAIGRRARCRIGLTGTLMPHSPLDLFGIYRFLDPTIFGTSIVKYRDRYAVMGGWQNKQIVGWRNRRDMHNRIARITMAVKSEDVLDLPEQVHSTLLVDMPPAARKLYAELKAEFVAGVAGGVITASNAAVKVMRLAQVASGFAIAETLDGEALPEPIEVHTAKRDALADWLDDLPPGEPCAVFYRFVADGDQIIAAAEKAGRGVMRLCGGTNELAAWQSGTGGEVLAVQIQAGGLGIDLTRGRHCMFYSNGDSLGDYEQAVKRMHRPGQTRTVFYTHLIARGTVDEKIVRAHQDKRNVIASVMEPD